MKIRILGFLLMCCVAPYSMSHGAAVSRVIPSGGDSNASATGSGSANNHSGNVSARTTTATAITDAKNTDTNSVRRVSRAVSVPDATPTGISARSVSAAGGIKNRSGVTGGAVSARSALEDAVSTVGRNARVSANSLNSNPLIRRSGISLRPTTAEVGGRAVIAGTDVQTGSNIAQEARTLRSRASVAQRENTVETRQQLEELAELNKSCQEQYNACMDQFCAVVDNNQKRCSCSANLEKYAKVERAVKDANTQLNEVAQRIRYVGLSADEISAIMTETEAEAALSGQKDKSETRDMLSKIESMIKDPASISSSSGNGLSGLDLDLDFSNNSSDFFDLNMFGSNQSDFSNLRGSALYNAAKKRCNSVLTQCTSAGATSQQVTGNYDLAIDKDCIAYEQGLTKMNETLLSNVRSANLMLQKARLSVLQNQNEYDAKECVSALETCMTDDMVCGENYYKCIDPTKSYIDENGKVILGSNISNISRFMENYNNASINTNFITTSSTRTISTDGCAGAGGGDGSCIIKYLLQKIGTGAKATENGLCRPVLDRCRYYTYQDGTYQPYNDIVINYIQRAMVHIYSAQSKIVADYASNCLSEISTCYNQQVSQIGSWTTSASVDSIYRVMNGACHNVALTCAYAVFAHDDLSCGTDESACIKNISEMFYQSLLCPDNSTYDPTAENQSPNNNGYGDGENETGGYVNNRCKCNPGYTVWGGQCVTRCPDANLRTRNQNTGACTCVANATSQNGICTCQSGYQSNNNSTECVQTSNSTP